MAKRKLRNRRFRSFFICAVGKFYRIFVAKQYAVWYHKQIKGGIEMNEEFESYQQPIYHNLWI